MNWRASGAGALIVIVAGLAVGIAIGGKTKTTPVTVRASAVAAPTASGDASGTAATDRVYLTAVPHDIPVNIENVVANSPDAQYSNSVVLMSVFGIDADCKAGASVTYRIPAGKRTFRTNLGWANRVRDDAAATLDIYLDDRNNRPADSWTYHVGDTNRAVSLTVTGHEHLIFIFTLPRSNAFSCPLSDYNFELGDARFMH